MHSLIHGNCLLEINRLGMFDCIFADPPDNIGLDYNYYVDNMKKLQYTDWLERCLVSFSTHTKIIWLSFNSKWTFSVGAIFQSFLANNPTWTGKACVQTFTFGQYNRSDLSNCHRPLWRLTRNDSVLYPDNILLPSWRQLNGDSRASPEGRVPGDVFDFTRVTGNSEQRRSWHPTQLNENLVRRCVLLSTKEGGSVLDPFAGTGTTLRVCKAANRNCMLIEIDGDYCQRIASEHNIPMKVTA